MSSLFGGRPADGRDPDLAEATRRRERAFARDIGDERALARADTPRYRRPRLWLLAFVALIAIVGGIRATRHPASPDITRSCTTPDLALNTTSIRHGDSVEWSGTGPASGRYVLVVDGTPTRVDSNNRVSVRGGRALTGTFTMSDCVVRSSFTAPPAGSHVLKLFHRSGGTFTLVAHLALRVS